VLMGFGFRFCVTTWYHICVNDHGHPCSETDVDGGKTDQTQLIG